MSADSQSRVSAVLGAQLGVRRQQGHFSPQQSLGAAEGSLKLKHLASAQAGDVRRH